MQNTVVGIIYSSFLCTAEGYKEKDLSKPFYHLNLLHHIHFIEMPPNQEFSDLPIPTGTFIIYY